MSRPMDRASLALAALAFLAAGCGAAPPTSTLRALFDTAEAHSAARRAPDLFARAADARQRTLAAERAGDREAADDEATRAQLLLAAAIAESDRIAFENRRLAAEARARRAVQAARRDEVATAETLRQTELGMAAEVAAEQGGIAFARAVGDERRRYRTSREERDQMHRDAVAPTVRRARLALAAAVALGAGAADQAQVQRGIDQAGQATDPAAALEAAEDAVRAAYAALGRVRATRGAAPNRDEVAALVHDAGEAGFDVEQQDRGVVVTVPRAFAGRSTRPVSAAVARLAQLLAAHPHGPVRIEVSTTTGATASRPRLARARADALVAALTAAGAKPSRVTGASVGDDPAGDTSGRVDAVFVAYAPPD